jgi:hypothetical protein
MQKLGLISKPDILNVARERREFEKEVEKLNSTNMNSIEKKLVPMILICDTTFKCDMTINVTIG